MKVTVEQSALVKGLSHVHRVVERRATIPILSNVLIRAEGTKLSLKATDLEIEVSESIAADVPMGGATTVAAHTFYDIVSKLPEGAQISLERDAGGGQISLKSGRSRFTLQALPESDFPDLSAGEMPTSFPLPRSDLKRLIEKTQFAISMEETRHYLNGIYFHTVDTPSGVMLRAAATDGHRLARSETPAPKGAAGMPGIIVPRKTVSEVIKLVSEGEGDAVISLSPQKIRFEVGSVVLISKLIDSTFPDYPRVIPVGNDKLLTVERGDFSRAVERVSTISSERGKAVKLALSENKLKLSVNNPDVGNAEEEIEASYDQPAMEIGFNARYLLDITRQLEGDTALFKLADAGSSALILDREGASSIYVLMPMRV